MASLREKNEEGKDKILKIERMTSRYHYCNVCHEHVGDEDVQNFVVGNKGHELAFGRNNFSTTVCLCTNCLNKFADLPWQYLEEEA